MFNPVISAQQVVMSKKNQETVVTKRVREEKMAHFDFFVHAHSLFLFLFPLSL